MCQVGNADELFAGFFGYQANTIAAELVSRAALSKGFESQLIGDKQHAITSTATVIYALGNVPGLSETLVRKQYNQLAAWVLDNGTVDATSADGPENTWRTAQCLLALCAWPKLISAPIRKKGVLLCRSLLRVQTLEGGFGFYPSDEPHPVFTFYPVLALLAAHRRGFITRRRLRKGLAQVAQYFNRAFVGTMSPTSGLCALHAMASIRRVFKDMIESETFDKALLSTEAMLLNAGRVACATETITSEQQPLFYAKINLPLLFLCARRIWPPAHPVTMNFSSELVESFHKDLKGWSNSESKKRIFSWTTALGILAGHKLCADLVDAGITAQQWEARRKQLATKRRFEFDVAICFAGKQRDVAETIAATLKVND